MQTDVTNQESAVKIAMDISGLSRLHYRLCSKRLESLGISFGQVPVFMVLTQAKGPVMQHEIADRIHVTPATISGTLKRMERDGMAVRMADPSDARISRVALSDRGRENSRQAFQDVCAGSCAMLAGFSAEEIETLNDMLRRMEANLSEAIDAQEKKHGGGAR